KAEGGKAIFRRLARTADVLLESFRPGVMDRLDLGWQALRAENPRLVYCAISGYGQDGPYRGLVGHDVNYMGYAGALSVTGQRAPRARRASRRPGRWRSDGCVLHRRRPSPPAGVRARTVRRRLDDGRRGVVDDSPPRGVLRDRPRARARRVAPQRGVALLRR